MPFDLSSARPVTQNGVDISDLPVPPKPGFDLASAKPVVDLGPVYDALRKADAAGNTADAKRLADYIRQRSNPRSVDISDLPVPPVNYNAALFRQRVGRDATPYELANFQASKGRGWAGDPGEGRFNAGQVGVGALEDAASLGTGAIAGIPAGLTYLGSGGNLEAAQRVSNALTYGPRTAAGQAGLQGIGDVVRGPGQVALWGADKLDPSGQLSNVLSDVGQRAAMASGVIPVAAGTGALLRGAPGAWRSLMDRLPDPEAPPSSVLQNAVDAVTRQASASPQNMGAAAAAPRVSAASPELQQAIAQSAQRTGGAINPDVLSRHLEADTLPVRVKLTEGQATQNPALISAEQNQRGKYPALLARFNEQNGQLVQNVQAIRDAVGPDVFSTNPVEHGDSLITAYRAKDAAAQANIAARYQALKDANGGQFPVDAQTLLDNATAQLHRQLLFDHAPKGVMATLNRLADTGHMTFENFESLRTNLARIQRSLATDGNEKTAAGVIRNAMEQLPLSGQAARLKPLADAARAAAKAQFDALEADPAYKAAVNETVPADRFVNRFMVNASRDDVALMRRNLGGDRTASQTMGVALLDHLRSSAGIDADGNGNFSAVRYNRALDAISPKLRSLVDPRTAEQLQTLGNVARYTQSQPRGSFVNNSGTLVGALANHGASALEWKANIAAHGIPVGTWGRKAFQSMAGGRAVRQAMAPGAGLTRLSPAPSPTPGLMSAPPRGGLMWTP